MNTHACAHFYLCCLISSLHFLLPSFYVEIAWLLQHLHVWQQQEKEGLGIRLQNSQWIVFLVLGSETRLYLNSVHVAAFYMQLMWACDPLPIHLSLLLNLKPVHSTCHWVALPGLLGPCMRERSRRSFWDACPHESRITRETLRECATRTTRAL